MIARIVRGTIFNTPHERGPVFCQALEAPDEFGNFAGFDSDGVRCEFNLAMVETVIRDGDAGVPKPGDGETVVVLTDEHFDTIRAGLRCLAKMNPEEWGDRVQLADERIKGLS